MEPQLCYTPLDELDARCRKLQQRLQKEDLDGALLLQNADLFYFSGTSQQAQLYIPAEGEPVLMARKDFKRARTESALRQVVAFTSPRQIPDILEQHHIPLPKRLGLELDVLPANQYLNYARLFENTDLTDISPAVRMLRAVKSEYEISLIRKAAQLSDQLAAAVPAILREGMTELELAGRIEAKAREWGHQGIIRMRMWGGELFYGHVMAGDAAAVPSYLASPTGGAGVNPSVAQGPGMRPIRRNEPVLVDQVFTWEGYLSDHTRIFSIGELPDDLRKAHQAMRDIQSIVKSAAKPGTAAGALYDLALKKADEFGLSDHFMGVGAQRIRFIGHGVGLELDEFPFLAKGQKLPLEKGMIIALEPKVIFPGKGVVGVENTHVVTSEGLEQLGSYPEEIVVV